ncbi:MAG: 4-(cytidine 5'-diphospho)-2-C-methyl-D-erythritol kinase [Deltaproteobacteria bacterium]|nr:4-(cytidine 5'-diphospho)-2-C-methyl-D-erythritol kinase [Deltaproteobacteria bacterium]
MNLNKYLSPAKINLFLKVLRKREDGYHDILSLMQPVSLYDEIILGIENGKGIFVECDNKSIPCDQTNLAYRAAEAFFKTVEISKKLSVKIKKNIPVAAGLGGGSSNAAIVLKALNEITSANISTDNLMKIAASLGSDIPFFIIGKSCIARGRGEILEPIAPPEFWYILINPGFPVSTQWTYQTLDKTGGLVKTKPLFSDVIKDKISYFVNGQNLDLTKSQENINITISKLLAACRTGGLGIPNMFQGFLMNDLEDVTIKKHPEIKEIKDALIDFGAIGALMSGSGPTVFGIFMSEDKARRAFAQIKKDQRFQNMVVFVAQGL